MPSVRDGGVISSVQEAVEVASKFPQPRLGFLVSRGQKKHAWGLQPSVFREERWFKYERHMIRELISAHPQEFTTDRSMFEKLVRMQHYGLPTRLLDVSSNFLVSLFFASEEADDGSDGAIYVIRGLNSLRKYYDSDTVSVLANLANLSTIEKRKILQTKRTNGSVQPDSFNRYDPVDRLLHFIRDEKPYFRPIIQKEHVTRSYLVVAKKSNRRIVAQSGAFLLFGLVDARTRTHDMAGFRLTKYRIPAGDKSDIRRSLNLLGINESSLYPEIDKAARQITSAYRS